MGMRKVALIGGSILAVGTCFTAYAGLRGGGPEAPAATRPVAIRTVSTRPLDADYAVPGVLDYRSWKPDYDVAPLRVRTPSLYRAAWQGNRTFRHSPDAAAMAQQDGPALPSDLSQQAAALREDAVPVETSTP